MHHTIPGTMVRLKLFGFSPGYGFCGITFYRIRRNKIQSSFPLYANHIGGQTRAPGGVMSECRSANLNRPTLRDA